MENLSFENKIALLALAKTPTEKAALIAKFSNNAEFFMGVNRRTMPLKQYMELNKEKFREVANRARTMRDSMKNHGWTDEKKQKIIAELPEDLVNDRPEFSAHLDRKVFGENVRKFLLEYPAFRVDK
jgi:hypothetical protein